MADSPTIVAAHLSDDALKKSVNSLVDEVNTSVVKMAENFNLQVKSMEDRIKSLGTVKIDSEGSYDGGSKRRSRSLIQEKQSVDEVSLSYDKLLGALQYAQRQERLYASKNIWSLTKEELEKYESAIQRVASLQEKLNEKSKEYWLSMVKSGQFTPNISDYWSRLEKESRDFSKQAREFYGEQEKESIRKLREDLAAAFKMPSSTIDEMRNKWAMLNRLLRESEGTNIFTPNQVSKAKEMEASLLHQLSIRNQIQESFDEEIRRMAQLIRESEEYKKNRTFTFKSPFAINGSESTHYILDESRKGALSIEEQLLWFRKHETQLLKEAIEKYKEITWQENRQIQLVNQQTEAEQRATVAAREKAKAEAEAAQNAQYAATAMQQASGQSKTTETFAKSYKTLQQEIADVLKIQTKEVNIAEVGVSSYERLSASLSTLQKAYNKLNAEQRGDLGVRIAEQMQMIQNAMKQIQSQSGRVGSVQDAMVLPEKTLEDITYKIQMLRSFAQGVNTDTKEGQEEVRKVGDEVEKLSQKAKELQKTTKQIQSEANAKRFEKISSMSESSYDAIIRKTREMNKHLQIMRSQPILDENGIRRAENELSKLGQSLNKINLSRGTTANINNAMNMTENSLDEIAKKMQRLQAIRSNLNLKTQKTEIENINAELAKLTKKQDEVLQKNQLMFASNTALGRSWNYMKNRLAFYFTVGASTAFVKQLAEIRGQYEMTEKSLGILVQSAERGSQIFREMSQNALVSPYTLVELSNAAKQLVAYDVAAKDVVDTTRRLADMTAAVGVPVERLTYALGQIKAYGYLNARDARMFSNTGIPLVKELSNYYTELEGRMVSVSDIYDRIKKKAIGYNDVMSVINKITDEGGRFFDYQAKMAGTLKVQLANLTLAWNNMLNDIGKSSQGFLSFSIGALKDIFMQWKNIETAIYSLGTAFGALKVVQFAYFAWFAKESERVGAAFAAQYVAGQKLTNVFKGLGASLKAIAISPWTWVFVAIGALSELAWEAGRARAETAALNNELKKNASEASQSIGEYVDSNAFKSVLELAKANKLSGIEGKKAWEGLREELEKSSFASRSFISELIAIEDVNERVVKGFEYADKIRRAQEALQNLNENTIRVTKDWAFGLFGEGLASDLQDYIDYFNQVASARRAGNEAVAENITPRLVRSEKEFQKELAITANSIKNFLDAYNIDDPLQIKEILARVKAQIVASNPEMSKAARQMFDIKLDEQFLTYGASDALQRIFFEQLRNNAASAFQDIDDDWIRSEEELNQKQQNAIDRTLQYFRSTLPEYSDSIEQMVNELNESGNLRVNIAASLNIRELNDFQRDMRERIRKAPKVIDFGGSFLDPQENENILSWAKRLQDDIKKLEEENEKLSKKETEWAKQQIAYNKNRVAQEKNRLDLYGLPYADDNSSKKDVLGEAIAKEVQLVGELQKRYKEYKKMGMDANTALQKATDEYRKSLEQTNKTLRGFGVTPIDNKTLAQLPLQEIKDAYKKQLEDAMRLGNAKGVEALEKAIAGLNVEINKIDYTKIVEGLNNELGKLKEEYELGVELDANPELGNIFADMMGIGQEDLAQLNRDAAAVAKKMQKAIREELGTGGLSSLADSFNIDELRNVGALEDWFSKNKIEKDSDLYKSIRSIVDYVNKTRLAESKKQIDEWNKLLEKYSEYEYKVAQIQKTAIQERIAFVKKNGKEGNKNNAVELETRIAVETDPTKKQILVEQLQKLVKEIAGDNNDLVQLHVAIDTKEARELAQLSFEEFQKSPEWISATGDLAGMTHKALELLIEDLEEYKKTAKNLDPKQIKQINKALRDLRKQQRSNPFAAIANLMEEAQARGEDFKIELDTILDEFSKLTGERRKYAEIIIENYESEDAAVIKLIDKYKKLKKEKEAVEKVSPKDIVDGINSAISAASQATQQFTQMMDALGGEKGTKASKVIEGIVGNLQAAGSGAAIGAQIGGGWGAAIGAISFGLMDGITRLAGVLSGNNSIDKAIYRSELSVKRLQNAYIDLEQTISKSYGTAEIGAKKAAIYNKRLQLSELERQLKLEESRKKKNRDEGKIEDLKGQIKELKNEITNSFDEIVNNILGISSVGDAMETFMDGFIESLRKGEDAMEVFDTNTDNMIANMVKKMLVSKIISPWFEEQWNTIQKDIDKRSEEYERQLFMYEKARKSFDSGGSTLVDSGLVPKKYFEGMNMWKNKYGYYEVSEHDYQKALDEWISDIENMISSTSVNVDDIKRWAELLRSGRPIIEENIEGINDFLKELDIMYNKASDSNLSALQAGIQGITEETAGALEAYMNGVSQQVYLHSDLLTQIRDTIQGFDIDAQTSTLSEILLQLRSSYETQQAIHSLLDGWNNASGNAVKVELVS